MFSLNSISSLCSSIKKRILSGKAKFTVDAVFFFLSIVFANLIYVEVKGSQFYSDVDFKGNLVSFDADAEFKPEVKLKTNSLCTFDLAFYSEVEADANDFIVSYKAACPTLHKILEKDDGNKILRIEFAYYVSDISDLKIIPKNRTDFYADKNGRLQNKQYGLPFKLCLAFTLAFFAVVFASYFLVNLITKKLKTPWNRYLVFAGLLGIGMIIINPAYNIPDERVHFNSAYNVSNILMGKGSYTENGNSIIMRECDNRIYPAELSDDPNFTRQVHEVMKTSEYKKYFIYAAKEFSKKQVLEEKNYKYDLIYNKGHYIFYLPAALGITLCRVLHLNQFFAFYSGCFFTLFVMLILIYIPFRLTRTDNILFYFFALIPFVLQQISHFQYDSFLFATATGSVVFFMNYYKERKLRDLILSMIYFVLMVPSKGGCYAPLALVYLVLFKKYFIRIPKKVWFAASIALVVAGLLGWAGLLHLKRDVSPYFMSVTQHGEPQLKYTFLYILKDPVGYCFIVMRTIYNSFTYLVATFFGLMLGTYELFIMRPFIVIPFFVLLYFVLADKTTVLAGFDLKIPFALLTFLITNFIFAAMLQSEGVGPIIYGVQGRYFIPYAIPLFMLFNIKKLRVKESKDNSVLLMYSLVLLDFLILINMAYLLIR